MLVQSRCRLVKNQNPWVLDQGPSDGDSLLLTTRELASLQTTILVEALRKSKLTFTIPLFVDREILQLLETLVNLSNLVL